MNVRRVLIFIGFFVLVLSPIVFFVIQRLQKSTNNGVTWKLDQKKQSLDRYSVSSDVPDFQIQLLDTRYLDYVSDNIGIFKEHAILDPEYLQQGSTVRHTVTRIKFVIVPHISPFLVAIPGQKDFVSTADYVVTGDTLIVRVWLNIRELRVIGEKRYDMEDAFLRATLQILNYAHGITQDPRSNAIVYRNIQEGIKNYLYNGVLPWPIRIQTP